MKRIEHQDVPRNCVVDLYIVSLNSHDHFIREKPLVLFCICALERLRYFPRIMEEELGSDPRSSPHSVLCSFAGGNVEVGSGWRETGVRETNKGANNIIILWSNSEPTSCRTYMGQGRWRRVSDLVVLSGLPTELGSIWNYEDEGVGSGPYGFLLGWLGGWDVWDIREGGNKAKRQEMATSFILNRFI